MPGFRPLVLDSDRGIPQVLEPGEVLEVGGVNGTVGGFRHTGGVLAFNNRQGLQRIPELYGRSTDVLTQVVDSLVELGLFEDHRRADWADGFAGLNQVMELGPYCTGRLIVGSRGGWTALDLPAHQPNILQVPARVNSVLAYAPVVTIGATPPLRPAPGCVWIDPATPTHGARMRAYVEPGRWVDIFTGALGDLQDAGLPDRGALLAGDGASWKKLLGGNFGDALMMGANGLLEWRNAVHAGSTAPLGTQRVGAFWLDTAVGSEALSLWDGARWRSIRLDSEVLNGMADLGPQLQDGEMLFWKSGRWQRLRKGNEGERLTWRLGGPLWEPALTAAATPPTARAGALWLDTTTHTLRIHDQGEWLDATGSIWSDANAAGKRLEPGDPVLLQAGWKLAGAPAAGLERFGGIVVAGSDAGDPTPVQYQGVVTLEAADFERVIDPTERTASIGLQPHNDYYLSQVSPGMLTRDRVKGGAIVGYAITANALFLYPQTGRDGTDVVRWFQQSLSKCLPTSLQDGDVIGWHDSAIDRARFINGDRTRIIIRHGHDLVDPNTGALVSPGHKKAVAKAPTDSGLINGTPYLDEGELYVSTANDDPALFWKLDNGGVHRLGQREAPHEYSLQAVDLATDQDAAQIQLTDDRGNTREVILRGAHGIEVTCTNRGTLVISGEALWQARLPGIDGGRFSPKPSFRPSAVGPGLLDAGRFTLPQMPPPPPLADIDAGDFIAGTP